MHLPPDVLAAAIFRLVVLSIVFTGLLRMRLRRHWPIWAAVVFGLASNALFVLGDLSWSGVFGVPYVGFIGWIFIDFMRKDPKALRALAGRNSAAWSKERHDLMNDLAGCRAQCKAYQLRLGIDSPE